MSSYRFSFSERWAIWEAYGKVCIYCGNPLRFLHLEIDHYIPESLNGTTRLQNLITEYSLDDDFCINSFMNWYPSCRLCNNHKGNTIFNKQTVLNQFAIYKRNAEQAEKRWRDLKRDTKSNAALLRIAVLMESGILTKSKIINEIDNVELGIKPDLNNPVIICFGLCIDDVLESDEAQDAEFASVFELIDYLKAEMSSEIEIIMNCRFEIVEDDYNDETLSIRYALWDVDLDKIDELNLKWWEILEVRSYKDVYGDSMLKG